MQQAYAVCRNPYAHYFFIFSLRRIENGVNGNRPIFHFPILPIPLFPDQCGNKLLGPCQKKVQRNLRNRVLKKKLGFISQPEETTMIQIGIIFLAILSVINLVLTILALKRIADSRQDRDNQPLQDELRSLREAVSRSEQEIRNEIRKGHENTTKILMGNIGGIWKTPDHSSRRHENHSGQEVSRLAGQHGDKA